MCQELRVYTCSMVNMKPIYGRIGMTELAEDIGYTYHYSRLIPCLIGLYSLLPNGEYQSIVWSYYGE